MNDKKLRLALSILSGRIESLADQEEYELMGLTYDPAFAYFTLKSESWINELRRRAEDILLEALVGHV
jgi:hypothetical protein